MALTLQPLIELADLETRLGRAVDDSDQARALIDDASALIRAIANSDFVDEQGQPAVPAAVVPVAVSMVRRGLNNPLGVSSEIAGSVQTTGMGAIYATRRERSIIRQAAGTLPASGLTLDGYLPVNTLGPASGLL